MTARRKVPDDFAQNASTMSHKALMNRYRMSYDTLSRWLSEIEIAPYSPLTPTLEIPADFAERARMMSRKELREYYKRSHETIRRWCRKFNIPAHKAPPPPKYSPPITRAVAVTAASAAANILRSKGKFSNVFRCDIVWSDTHPSITWAERYNNRLEKGEKDQIIPNRGMGYYFVSGRGVMTEGDMIALAKTYENR